MVKKNAFFGFFSGKFPRHNVIIYHPETNDFPRPNVCSVMHLFASFENVQKSEKTQKTGEKVYVGNFLRSFYFVHCIM
jgi:hypothetical protein